MWIFLLYVPIGITLWLAITLVSFKVFKRIGYDNGDWTVEEFKMYNVVACATWPIGVPVLLMFVVIITLIQLSEVVHDYLWERF
jgi:hypothetical protein